jgi:hypothetical protein
LLQHGIGIAISLAEGLVRSWTQNEGMEAFTPPAIDMKIKYPSELILPLIGD